MTGRSRCALLRDPLRLDDLRGQERRRAEVADLALADEVGQRAERLVDVDLRPRAVHLVEVDVVDLQAAQRVLDLADDPAARAARLVGVLVVHVAVELGGQEDVVAAALAGLQRLADDLLGLAAGVDVGGVDDVDAGVEGAVDDRDRLVVVGVAPRAEHHRAEGQRADLDAGPAEGAVVLEAHAVFSSVAGCVLAGGALEAEVVAQRGSCVLRAEQPASAQDRHDLLDEHLDPSGQPRRHHVEAVGGAGLGPLLDRVGDLVGRAGDDPVAARTGEPVAQLAERGVLALDDVEHELEAAALAALLVGVDDLARERLVEVVRRQVDAGQPVELGERVPRLGEVVELLVQVLGLLRRGPDERADARAAP